MAQQLHIDRLKTMNRMKKLYRVLIGINIFA